ncbi:MAG TPA: endonuclease/exonuclease/phosphatase family protein [Candidatus Dormibacteraeota bacterium]
MAATTIRVLTLNCLFHGQVRARLPAIGSLLEKGQFDLVCLQEVAFQRHARLLASLMPSYRPPVYRSWALGVMGGLVTFARAEVKRSGYEMFRRRGDWGTLGAADRLGRKGFLTTWFEVAGEPLLLVNTHLLANYDEDWSPSNRYAVQQLDELNQLGDALGNLEKDALLLVAGDFNVPADHPMLAEFMSRTGLRNAAATPAATYRSLNPEVSGQQIDHVFFRHPPGASVSTTTKLHFEEKVALADGRTMYASDHFGVEAGIDLLPASALSGE